MRPYFLPWVACARTGVGIAGCRWYLPIDGTRTRLHRKSSNAAGQADGSSWDHRNCWTRPLAIALPPNLAAKQLPAWIKRGKVMERLAVSSAVIGLMFLISWPSAVSAGQQGISITEFTS